MTCPSHIVRYVPGGGKNRRGEEGYILMTLLLAMALLMIFAAVIVPSITFDIKRDREEEMIHRGVQYSRAIRAYYKKFGRYPTKIEDLENTSALRFLRKRYKDPLNCKNSQCADFRLLHFGEVQMTLSVIGGAPAAIYIGAPGFAQNPLNGNNNSPLGQNQPGVGNSSTGSDTSQLGSQASSGGTANPSGSPDDSSGSNPLGSGQIIGGPIIGVASTSKDKTIREFNHKNKYKDWVFVYDPGQDMGRLITTPYQPQLLKLMQQNLNGPNGTTGFGSANGGTIAAPQGTQNTPNSPNSGGFGPPNPPNNPPEQ